MDVSYRGYVARFGVCPGWNQSVSRERASSSPSQKPTVVPSEMKQSVSTKIQLICSKGSGFWKCSTKSFLMMKYTVFSVMHFLKNSPCTVLFERYLISLCLPYSWRSIYFKEGLTNQENNFNILASFYCFNVRNNLENATQCTRDNFSVHIGQQKGHLTQF